MGKNEMSGAPCDLGVSMGLFATEVGALRYFYNAFSHPGLAAPLERLLLSEKSFGGKHGWRKPHAPIKWPT